MSLKLNGATSGSIEIDVPAEAGTDTAITIPATTGGEFIVSDSNGDVNIDSGTFFVDASTNRVGIGTTTVSGGLHVEKDVNPVLRLDRGTANTTNANLYYNGTLRGQLAATSTDFIISAAGASSPMKFFANGSERMRITQDGILQVSPNGSYVTHSPAFHQLTSTQSNKDTLYLVQTNTSFGNETLRVSNYRTNSSGFTFITCTSGNLSDDEFRLRGDGNAYADASWNGGGADYAEYFEWSDGNPDEEDRRGISVVLDGDRIRPAIDGEDPIGVISGNPSVVGDAAWNKWSGKYLRDEFGTYIQEDYEVEDDDGNTVIQQRRKLNPAYDPDVEYVNRENRPEWDAVGLMGKLRIRKGQVTGARWIKMRDVSDSVEEWLVR